MVSHKAILETFFGVEPQFKGKITAEIEQQHSFEKRTHTIGKKLNAKVIVKTTLFGKYQK